MIKILTMLIVLSSFSCSTVKHDPRIDPKTAHCFTPEGGFDMWVLTEDDTCLQLAEELHKQQK